MKIERFTTFVVLLIHHYHAKYKKDLTANDDDKRRKFTFKHSFERTTLKQMWLGFDCGALWRRKVIVRHELVYLL